MTEAAPVERTPWAIPPGALAEWLRLAAVLEEAGAVPCQTDTEAWFPDGKQMDAPSTRMAVRACWQCLARAACADYGGGREGACRRLGRTAAGRAPRAASGGCLNSRA